MAVFRENKLFAFYTGLVALIVLLAIFAPFLAPQDPMAGDMKLVLQTPSGEHWLGTDKLGRDIFSRILCGTQISLFMALCLVALIAAVGTLVGVLAGYFGGWIETILMRLADMMLAFPGIVLAIAIAGILGGSVVNTILALLVVSWAKYARLVRSLVLRLRNQDFIRAALICGCDRETYNKVLLKGTFLPGKAPVPPSMDYGFDQLTDPNAYNPERAAQLLDEAGWKDTNGDGIRDKDGQPLKLDFVVYNSRAELPLYAEAVQSDLKKLGFDINIKTVDYNLVDQMGIKGEYDLLISNITTANTGDPEIFLSWYWKSNHNGENPQNGSGYSNPALDDKFEALSVEFDKEKRRQLIIEIQQMIMNDGAALFLGYPQTNIISSKALSGVKMYPSDYYWITNLIKPAK